MKNVGNRKIFRIVLFKLIGIDTYISYTFTYNIGYMYLPLYLMFMWEM